MRSGFVELVGKRATQPPDAWRQGFHGDAVSPQLDSAEQRRLVGAAQLHWPGRADGLKRGPDRLRVPTEVSDLVEETVAARPRQLNDIARCGDRYPVAAFGHGLESRTGCADGRGRRVGSPSERRREFERVSGCSGGSAAALNGGNGGSSRRSPSSSSGPSCSRSPSWEIRTSRRASSTDSSSSIHGIGEGSP